jgi:hypothetical protein
VDDPFLVGVLNSLADQREQFETLPSAELLLVAIICDRYALDQFHGEIRPTLVGCARIVDPGDAGVVHHRQCLPFGFEACHDLVRVHAPLDQLQSYFAADRLLLLCLVDFAHTAFAELAGQVIRSDIFGVGRFLFVCLDARCKLDQLRVTSLARIGFRLQGQIQKTVWTV